MLDGRRGRVEHSKFSFEHQKSSKTAAAGGARAARSRRPRRGDQGRRPWRRGPAQSRGEPPGHGRGARKRLHRQEAMPNSAARSGDRRATLRTARKPATRKGNAVLCCATGGPPCNATQCQSERQKCLSRVEEGNEEPPVVARGVESAEPSGAAVLEPSGPPRPRLALLLDAADELLHRLLARGGHRDLAAWGRR